MNAHQRRKEYRKLLRDRAQRTPGCGAQFYSGTCGYPDLSCWDTYLGDDDADGYDPTESRTPCPNCRPEEYQEWLDDLGRHVIAYDKIG